MVRQIDLKLLSSLTLIFVALTTGCGRPQDVGIASIEESDRAANSETHGPHLIIGALQGHITQLLDSDEGDPCNSQNGEKIREIAQALDERQAEIDEATRNEPPSALYKQATLGPTYVRELVAPLHATEGWKEYYKSWSQRYEQYQSIKNTPTDARWVAFNSAVRSLVFDDRSRAQGSNMYLDRRSGPQVALLLEALSVCHADTACTRISLTPALELFVRTNPQYDRLWSQLIGQNERSILVQFYNKVLNDNTRYKFYKNSTARRTRTREITLPLSLGVFSDVADQLITYIEEAWTSRNLRIKIQPTDIESTPSVFKVLLGPETGGRSFVEYTHRTIRLFPNVQSRSIAHEIGHVLGFRDHYYTIWEPSECRYRIQYREDDLMSNTESGNVLPDEWDELRQQYPLRSQQ